MELVLLGSEDLLFILLWSGTNDSSYSLNFQGLPATKFADLSFNPCALVLLLLYRFFFFLFLSEGAKLLFLRARELKY